MLPSRILVSVTLGLLFILLGMYAKSENLYKPIKVEMSQLTKESRKSVKCLAENIYFESAYEPVEGRIAVAFVTLNRVNSGLYPDDICSVVKQRIQNVCQFSWYCERGKQIQNLNAYKQAEDIALYVYANYERLKDPSNGALFYHADYVRPKWKNVEKTVTIGRHIFYTKKEML